MLDSESPCNILAVPPFAFQQNFFSLSQLCPRNEQYQATPERACLLILFWVPPASGPITGTWIFLLSNPEGFTPKTGDISTRRFSGPLRDNSTRGRWIAHVPVPNFLPFFSRICFFIFVGTNLRLDTTLRLFFPFLPFQIVPSSSRCTLRFPPFPLPRRRHPCPSAFTSCRRMFPFLCTRPSEFLPNHRDAPPLFSEALDAPCCPVDPSQSLRSALSFTRTSLRLIFLSCLLYLKTGTHPTEYSGSRFLFLAFFKSLAFRPFLRTQNQ